MNEVNIGDYVIPKFDIWTLMINENFHLFETALDIHPQKLEVVQIYNTLYGEVSFDLLFRGTIFFLYLKDIESIEKKTFCN